MQTFLRFTHQELANIVKVCRSLQLTESSLRSLKELLVESLRSQDAALAERIAGFHRYQVGIVYEWLAEWRKRGAQDSLRGPEELFSPEELQVISQACMGMPIHDRFLSYCKVSLVMRFQASHAALASRISSLNESELQRLFQGVRTRDPGA